MHAAEHVEEAFVFAADTPAGEQAAREVPKPWRIMIVDDNEDVHMATVLALRDTVYQGRGIEFVHAYSAQQGSSRLRYDSEIALVLLDVVMETQDAGLRLARHLRDDLGDHQVQIVLRTGQPGNAPERDIIVDYEINDYLSKGALTGTQLFTTVISSLRAYESLSKGKAQHDALLATASKVMDLELKLDQSSKNTQAVLQESEARWKCALDSAGDGAWDVNFETGAVVFSKHWKQVHGYPEDTPDMKIAGWKNLIHPDDVEQVMAAMREYLAGNTPTFASCHRCLQHDGSWQWVLDRGVIVKRSAAGKPVQMVGTHTNIPPPM
jgi:PAS domain S-box-containing protein